MPEIARPRALYRWNDFALAADEFPHLYPSDVPLACARG
jgi:hypothetical protein